MYSGVSSSDDMMVHTAVILCFLVAWPCIQFGWFLVSWEKVYGVCFI